MSTLNLDRFERDVVLPSKSFNLAFGMMNVSSMQWDFDKIRHELDEIEARVRSFKGQKADAA